MPSQQYLISMQPLVHMCRWWRGLVFALPYHLNLQLFCTIKIPARVTQDIWPTLPLLIQGDVFKTSLNDVIAELEHSDHICKIKLNCYTSSQIKKLWTAMQVLGACTSEGLSYQPVLPNSFLGLSLLCMHSECLLSCNFVFLSMYSTIPESHSGHVLKLHWTIQMYEILSEEHTSARLLCQVLVIGVQKSKWGILSWWVRMAWNEAKAKDAKVMIVK